MPTPTGVTFGSALTGTSAKLQKGQRVLAKSETTYFNVPGASVIVGELGPRDIQCVHWLHNSYGTRDAVKTEFDTQRKLIGKTKTLSNAIGEEYENCLLEAIDETEGPVLNNLGWMYVLLFRWRQLS